MRHSSSEPDLRSDLKSTLEFNTLLVFGHLYVCHSRRQLFFFVNSWSMRKITTSWQSGPGPMPRRLPTEKFPACSSRRVRSHYCDFLSFALLLQRAQVDAHTCENTDACPHAPMCPVDGVPPISAGDRRPFWNLSAFGRQVSPLPSHVPPHGLGCHFRGTRVNDQETSQRHGCNLVRTKKKKNFLNVDHLQDLCEERNDSQRGETHPPQWQTGHHSWWIHSILPRIWRLELIWLNVQVACLLNQTWSFRNPTQAWCSFQPLEFLHTPFFPLTAGTWFGFWK